jgi:D-aspartate ligase
MSPGAVVVGAHANGLGVIRALGPRGVRIASVSTRAFDIAQYSRWVAERWQLPQLHERREALVEFLEAQAGRWNGWTVFPTNDDALTALAEHHERLSRTYRLTVQPWERVAPLVDKDRMDALAREAGVDLPMCFGRATPATAARGDLRYPVLVKPIQHDRLISLFGTKLFLANDVAELRTAIARLAAAECDGLVYDFIPGPDSNIYVYCVYLDAHGEPSPGITVRKLRQNPPRIGGARVAEVAPEEPRLRDATVALLRRAGFRGMAFAEFKRDPATDRFVFIEVNGRAVLFNGILRPTGLDLATMAWSDFGLGTPFRPTLTGWNGTWIHLQPDLVCAVRHRRVEKFGLAEWIAPYRRPTVFADWSASDPKPFLAQSALALRGLFARAGTGGDG